MESVERKLDFLHEKVTDLEDRSRRSNLVVFGIKENPSETTESLKKDVLTDIFATKLQVSCHSVGRIHRIGKHGNQRPVIVFFQDYNEKEIILKNAHKLKGSDISIQNDYSKETLRKRKLLWESAKSEKGQGMKVTLNYDKLHVDRDTYKWDDAMNVRVKITSLKNRTSNP